MRRRLVGMKSLSTAALTLALLLSAPLAAQEVKTSGDGAGERTTYAAESAAGIRAMEAGGYLLRIAEVDDAEPGLDAVIDFNDQAPRQAYLASEAGTLLDGRTLLVKDNIETAEWPTTAGSLALAANATGRDAPLVANLRRNGGVVLGKTNLSEWANIRGSSSSSGWSATGGQTRNPHALDRSPCGSSSGSGAAVAAGLAWAAIGTETDGSITCPASVNGIVGFKPSVGLVSRTHIVPISASQDTAGPMARTVRDAAMLLTAMVGPDPLDSATAAGAAHVTDFTAGLATASLQGVRIGVLRKQAGGDARVIALFDQALADMRAAGADLVEIDFALDPAMGEAEYAVLLYELREGLDAYLQDSPADIPVRSLEQVIDFNRAHAAEELRWFGQDIFEAAFAATDEAAYRQARATSLRLAGAEGIDRLLAEHGVDLLVAPTEGPAWPIDLIAGDRFVSPPVGAGNLAAIAGYPHLTVPMGAVEGLPVGLSIMGAQWQDHRVLLAGAAFERARSAAVPQARLVRWGD
jgi:amidase